MNFFNPFVRKELGQEDPLTRAFLVMLRYEPLAQALFLDLVRHTRAGREADVSPLTEMDGALVADTQVGGKLPYTNGTVVSVLITDEQVSDLPEVRWSDRGAVYDGVLSFGEWVFLLESKPAHEAVWPDQLNPSHASFEDGHELQLERRPVCLTWKDILAGLLQLEAHGLVQGTGSTLLDDFLVMVDEHYPHLAPYKKFSLCKNDLGRLNRRCRMVLEEVGEQLGAEVQTRSGRSPHLSLPNSAVQEVHLEARPTDSRDSEWRVDLEMWPADTVAQARRFYPNVDRAKFLGLREKGWEVGPNLHFSFMSTHLVWASGEISVERYLDLIASGDLEPGQASAEDPDFTELVRQLQERGLVTPDDLEQLKDHFLRTQRTTMNVVPGMYVGSEWNQQDAIDLDASDRFVSAVQERIQQTFETWEQPM